MPGPLRLTGVAASGGYAAGPLFHPERAVVGYAAKGSPRAEAEALKAAVAAASRALDELIAASPGEAAAILEFQVAMLEDDALVDPALEAIQAGATAYEAWGAELDGEIAGYATADDEYFKARAADLRDIRQRVLHALSGHGETAAPAGAILCADDIAPTLFLRIDWSKGGGIALSRGSPASHVAMLARSRGVPMVVGLGERLVGAAGFAVLDAEHGEIVLAPAEADLRDFRGASDAFIAAKAQAGDFLAHPAVTADGTAVRVHVNVADPAEVDAIDIDHCDGVGLMRTEFLFGATLPDEESQFNAYRKVLEWAKGKPVTIRTVDAGGDKPVAGYTIEEGNPFLGLRGIRLSLSRPEVFRVQIRALLRAAGHGNLKVMFPMVAIADEYRKATELFLEEADVLTRAGISHGIPPLGVMVEVPAAAIAPEEFSDAAFFSIGSNDLTQYVMAAARDNGAVAGLNAFANPAVQRLIAGVVAYGDANDIPVSLCGDAAGDPQAIPGLLAAGLRDLSAAPAQLAAVKAAIAAVSLAP
ncbi:MAG TPA: phosphoenolpyruvate--protein phosphotransferase [Rhizobiaceae bacterium]|nr:phosphoenolpyruvate--protein phosphotransferase [Rhizobiaceae bacterium]